MTHHNAYHLAAAERHIERGLDAETNDTARALMNQAIELLIQAGKIVAPDDIDRLRREQIDPMM